MNNNNFQDNNTKTDEIDLNSTLDEQQPLLSNYNVQSEHQFTNIVNNYIINKKSIFLIVEINFFFMPFLVNFNKLFYCETVKKFIRENY